ncbi:Integrin alpha-3 [Frankliniella fusca]|uniref:Integrin alpha-3 n=1 Tax=Frankliniella fusca TaxID=407009 RepID=A0AAE1L7U0_9NEOP|nr:Integrin alpha-3 [Frankliniella fusca]
MTWLCLTAALCCGLLAASATQHARTLGLEQILDDGQPEDIGYGFQRARTNSRNIRNTRPDGAGLLLMERAALQDEAGLKHHALSEADADEPAPSSAFRERMASRPRRQRQQQQRPWGDWHRESPSPSSGSPGVSSFYPAAGPSDPLDNPERYLQALREAWARYQQQTGAIDVGPDDLTDLETLQFLEALGEDIPGTRKRTSNPGRQFANGAASPWDWAAPLAWSGYQLRKRSASPDYQDDSTEWSDEAAVAPEEAEADVVGPGAANNRLAMLLSQQLFDERYNDPAIKRLLLSKRSLPGQHQVRNFTLLRDQKDFCGTRYVALQPAQNTEEMPEAVLPGLQGRAMRRRKKSTRPALDIPQPSQAHDAKQDLMAIFGENEPDGELEPPLALPLAGAPPEVAAEGTAAPATASTAAPPAKDASAAPTTPGINPIGHAHETDKIAKEHALHATHAPSTVGNKASVNVQVHGPEHAPPMVSAEGPHSHDQALHAEDKDKKPTVPPTAKPGSPAGAAAGPTMMGAHDEDASPLALPQHQHRRLIKKSIDWSQYFGIDRRRKKSLSLNDVDSYENAAQVDADWLMRHNLMAFSPRFSKPSNINKRVAIKREGASPDMLLLSGAFPFRKSSSEDDEDESLSALASPMPFDGLGRCPALTRLVESCRGAVGANDGLLPLCVLYQACQICGAAVGLPPGWSCEAELDRHGAELCGAASSAAREEECRAAVEGIRRSRPHPHEAEAEADTCHKQPCLAHFFLTAPAVAFAR